MVHQTLQRQVLFAHGARDTHTRLDCFFFFSFPENHALIFDRARRVKLQKQASRAKRSQLYPSFSDDFELGFARLKSSIKEANR